MDENINVFKQIFIIGRKLLKDLKILIAYTINVEDIYSNIHECNRKNHNDNNNNRVLIIFDDMIVNMVINAERALIVIYLIINYLLVVTFIVSRKKTILFCFVSC